MSIWNKQAEMMPREELEKIQMERLKSILQIVYDNVPFYKKMFQE